ncbi:DUF805 domain-containing protein [Paenarthrobacter sp. PH39-S1]|uniref:DUF805 domain-containing protein n=1 Tax=Paenarthrobacter sp. PH39-S1 TaxID=3046204 RepID=UPI0024B8A5AB|nr:DUF805 domain-containing protein [Paenarthrobacter sp. PH39-S1]MDJ0358596.1 DUF805 domain-containing protein [Paenarthrobacter sp. PH39-S1]
MALPQQSYSSEKTEPLWAPLYGASLPDAVKRFWKKYVVFSGRASRSEYWWWALVSAVVVLVLEIIGAAAGGAGATVAADGTSVPGPGFGVAAAIIGLWGLATIIPGLALLSRRLHDGNFSAWFILLGLVPFLGAIALLVMTLMPSNPQGRRFDGPVAVQQGSGYQA